jgi:uncharacterized membrane protein YfcA
MALDIFQILLLIGIGTLVGISLSFAGQTGQGIVLPIILMLTGDVFLAIAINLLNDLVTTTFISIKYIRNNQFQLHLNIFIILFIGVLVSFGGVFILMTTPLGNLYGWFIPSFIIVLGMVFLKNGFPTTESIKNLAKRFKSKNKDEELTQSNANKQGLIKIGSRTYYILALGFGIFIGVNSGMFGANSGLVFVLALVILYGYPLKKGVGTALILSVLISLCSFMIYQTLGYYIKSTFYFNLEISFFLGIGSVISGIISSIFTQKISVKSMGRAIGFIIFILGIISLTFYFIS